MSLGERGLGSGRVEGKVYGFSWAVSPLLLLPGPAQRTEGVAGRAGGARVRRRPPDQEQRAVEVKGQGRLPLRTSEVVASP